LSPLLLFVVHAALPCGEPDLGLLPFTCSFLHVFTLVLAAFAVLGGILLLASGYAREQVKMVAAGVVGYAVFVVFLWSR
jgi:hypothetical protein